MPFVHKLTHIFTGKREHLIRRRTWLSSSSQESLLVQGHNLDFQLNALFISRPYFLKKGCACGVKGKVQHKMPSCKAGGGKLQISLAICTSASSEDTRSRSAAQSPCLCWKPHVQFFCVSGVTKGGSALALQMNTCSWWEHIRNAPGAQLLILFHPLCVCQACSATSSGGDSLHSTLTPEAPACTTLLLAWKELVKHTCAAAEIMQLDIQ